MLFLLSVDPLPDFLHPAYIPPVNGGGRASLIYCLKFMPFNWQQCAMPRKLSM